MKSTTIDTTKNVFAKLKNYALEPLEANQKKNQKTNTTKTNPTNNLIKSFMVNRYTHKGKIQDFDILQRKHKTMPLRRKLTFAEWQSSLQTEKE